MSYCYLSNRQFLDNLSCFLKTWISEFPSNIFCAANKIAKGFAVIGMIGNIIASYLLTKLTSVFVVKCHIARNQVGF